MSNERDTKFQGFAKLLFQDMLNASHGHIDVKADEVLARAEFEEHIARRAYDLVEHVFNQMAVSYSPGGVRGMIPWLRDMDTWPEQERFANTLADLAKIHEKLLKRD